MAWTLDTGKSEDQVAGRRDMDGEHKELDKRDANIFRHEGQPLVLPWQGEWLVQMWVLQSQLDKVDGSEDTTEESRGIREIEAFVVLQ